MSELRHIPTEETVFDPGRNGWIVSVGPTGVPKLTLRNPGAAAFGLLSWRMRKRAQRSFTVSVREATMLRRSNVHEEVCDSYEAAVRRASELADQIRREGIGGL